MTVDIISFPKRFPQSLEFGTNIVLSCYVADKSIYDKLKK